MRWILEQHSGELIYNVLEKVPYLLVITMFLVLYNISTKTANWLSNKFYSTMFMILKEKKNSCLCASVWNLPSSVNRSISLWTCGKVLWGSVALLPLYLSMFDLGMWWLNHFEYWSCGNCIGKLKSKSGIAWEVLNWEYENKCARSCHHFLDCWCLIYSSCIENKHLNEGITILVFF